MAAPSITWKRAQTFAALVEYVPGEGDPANLSGVTIETDVMDAAQRRYALIVEIDEGLMSFRVYNDNTIGWGLGTASWDFRFTLDNVVFYSSTVRFTIEPNITIPAHG
jgi:hypothetical protein